MRTIKFRGKSEDNSEWFYGFLQKYQEKYASRLCVCAVSVRTWKDALLYSVKPDTVGQFTGLFDKNDKEIFEGDVVKWSNGLMYVVKFLGGMFYASVEECNEGILGGFPLHRLTEYEDGKCEIVGNIFDNPELLKGFVK